MATSGQLFCQPQKNPVLLATGSSWGKGYYAKPGYTLEDKPGPITNASQILCVTVRIPRVKRRLFGFRNKSKQVGCHNLFRSTLPSQGRNSEREKVRPCSLRRPLRIRTPHHN